MMKVDSQMDFLEVALRLCRERQWLTMPLTLDGNGLPKKPYVDAWTSLIRSEETIRGLPWDRAKGIGIILGKQSNNLAALDIDDVDLADTLIGMMTGAKPALTIRTARKRCHIYVHEPEPSTSTTFDIQWRGRTVGIELKTTGTQIAAPPTTGYSIAIQGQPVDGDVRTIWKGISARLAQQFPDDYRELTHANNGANYPTPWQATVPIEKRNKALYIEAHKLRQAGVPLDLAVQMLTIRVQQSYAPGDFGQVEITRTIRSAYMKLDSGATPHDDFTETDLIR